MFNKILLFLFIFVSVAICSETMSITVRKAQVRSAPSFMGKIMHVLNYTAQVSVLKDKNGWVLVSSGNDEKGWVHKSALTDKKLVLNLDSADVTNSVTDSEVALAGKGFNSQLEEVYKSSNNIDYSWVDEMETYVFDIVEVLEFIGE